MKQRTQTILSHIFNNHLLYGSSLWEPRGTSDLGRTASQVSGIPFLDQKLNIIYIYIHHALHGHNTLQYCTNVIQYNTIQYNTIQYNTIQYSSVQVTSTSNTLQLQIPRPIIFYIIINNQTMRQKLQAQVYAVHANQIPKQHHTMQCNAIHYTTALHHTIGYYNTLHKNIQYSALRRVTLGYTTIHYTTLHDIVSHYTRWHCIRTFVCCIA